MSLSLNAQEQGSWTQDGYFVREAVFDTPELTELRCAVEQAAATAAAQAQTGRTYLLDGKRFVDAGFRTVQFEHEPGSETVRVIEPVHDLHPALTGLIDDPRIVAPMTDLVGTRRIALWTDKLNLKRPREGSGFGWHQDSPYWIHDCGHVDRLPNVMLALDDANLQNGCFRVIRGSHTRGCLPGTADGSQLGGFFTDPDTFDADDQVAMAVAAGSLVFFSPHSVHGSLPNRSGDARRALILTYQPADHPMLKSGRVRNVATDATPAGQANA